MIFKIGEFLKRTWLYLIIVIIGIALKFYKIDNRFFWYDEICTIGHTSGNQIFENPANEIKNINFYSDQLSLKKQNLTIGSELKGLFTSTNLNPLHYTFLMIWYRIVGDSMVHYRLFSVFIFILTLPFLYLLAKQLFKSDLAGWIAVCLYCFSPYFHYYAQMARYHILWAFLLIVLHYLFLNATSHNKPKWWICYTAVGILSLYANILSGLVIIGHLIYMLVIRRDLWITYSVNAVLIFFGYLPWLISLIINRSDIIESLTWHSWLGSNLGIFKLIIAQLWLMAASFVSLNGFYGQLGILASFQLQGNYLQFCISVLLVVLILFSIIYAIKKLPKEESLFLILILLPQFLFFIISDLIRNTAGSLSPAYHVITFTGILLFIVFLIYRKTQLGKLLYLGIFLGLVVFGFASIFINLQNRCWDTALNCQEIIMGKQLTSAHEKQLIIMDHSKLSGTNFPGFLTIVNENENESDNIDYLLATPDIKNIKEMLLKKDYSAIYVVYASDKLVQNLKTQFAERMDSLEIGGTLPMWSINLK